METDKKSTQSQQMLSSIQSLLLNKSLEFSSAVQDYKEKMNKISLSFQSSFNDLLVSTQKEHDGFLQKSSGILKDYSDCINVLLPKLLSQMNTELIEINQNIQQESKLLELKDKELVTAVCKAVVSTNFQNCNTVATSNTLFYTIGKSQYHISPDIITKYPDSLLAKVVVDQDSLLEDGSFYIDHDDHYFDCILNYIRDNDCRIHIYPPEEWVYIYEDFVYYNIPIPSELSFIRYNYLRNKYYRQSQLFLLINKKKYVVEKLKLLEKCRPHSFFETIVSDENQRITDDGYWIINRSDIYFDYICQYINTDHFKVSQENIDDLDQIQSEFDFYGIHVNPREWEQYDPCHLYFNHSTILNANQCLILNQWYGKQTSWKLIYKGTRDGFSAQSFHNHCDNRGETIVLIQNKYDTSTTNIFGGYTSIPWTSPSQAKAVEDTHAFLFTLQNVYTISPTKFPVINPRYAIRHSSLYGPIFGSSEGNKYIDLFIDNNCNMNKNSYTSLSGTNNYENSLIQGHKLFVNTNSNKCYDFFTVDEIEVFMKNVDL
ncbi:hypothetical protein WA158_001231 [Blastocystis sp. Blastoise]